MKHEHLRQKGELEWVDEVGGRGWVVWTLWSWRHLACFPDWVSAAAISVDRYATVARDLPPPRSAVPEAMVEPSIRPRLGPNRHEESQHRDELIGEKPSTSLPFHLRFVGFLLQPQRLPISPTSDYHLPSKCSRAGIGPWRDRRRYDSKER